MIRSDDGTPTTQVETTTFTTWHTLRATAETGLDDTGVIALADSMQPAP